MASTLPRLAAGTAAALLAAGALTACGGGSNANTSNSASPAKAGPDTTAAAGQASSEKASPLVAGLPAALKSQYVGLPTTPHKSAWASFKGTKKPWKACYADSYQGNPWRVALANDLKRLAAQYKQAGLVSGFAMSVSDNDVARQNQQIRQFVDQGCSVIFTVAASPTGLNQAIAAAHAKGVPVVTLAGSVTSPYAVNVDSNYYVLGRDMAQAIADSGAKNVLMVEGIQGSPIAVLQNDGAKAAFKAAGVNVVAEVNGNWTPSVTKQVVLKALATHPTGIDAVWSTGSESAVIAQAFKQAGHDTPLITASISGDALGYWHENQGDFKFSGVALMPTWTAETAWRAGMRTLAGNGPKIDPIMVPVPQVDQSTLPKLYQPCMKPDSASVFPVVPNDPLPNSLMGAYFEKPGAVGPYDYAKTPGPCAGA